MWRRMEDFSKHLGDLTSQATHHREFAFVGPRSFIPSAFDWYQPFVDLGPFTVLHLDCVADDEEEHLLHGSSSCSRQLRTVQGLPRLGDGWSPAKVGFETGC